MAKVKNKRNSGLADKVHNKRKAEANKKKLNPFEVHINREKIKVLGKKSKHDKGLPGVSRGKAIQKRKETLGTEMKLMNKTNTFIDKRIGEKSAHLSAEERMVARFTAERLKQHNKKSVYNLADDEILTHRGQTLEQIEKFDDPRSDDEEEEGKRFGGLGDDFVSDGHFGGGILSKTDSKDGAKSHKDLIEQLIAESKKRKAEKQKEKEQTLDLTEKLDSEWKDLQPVVFKRPRVEESAIDKVLSKAEKKGEDYDKMMRELKFEKRGTPSDGLKSDEKKAREEREKLEEWERERQERMLGEPIAPKVQKTTSKHRSAEDLDDNFELEDEKEFMLSYDKDGNPLVPEHVLKDFSVPNARPKFDDGISDTSSDDDGNDDEKSDDDEEDDDSNESSDDSSDEKTNKIPKPDKNSILFQKPEKKVDEQNGDESSDETSEEENVNTNKNISKLDVQKNNVNQKAEKKLDISVNTNKDASKLDVQKNSVNRTEKKLENTENGDEKSGDESDSSGEESDQESENDQIDDYNDLKGDDDSNESDDDDDDGEIGEDKTKIDSFFDKKILEGDNLKDLLADKTPAQMTVLLQKLIKSYDPSLAENNKDLLSRLFAHMLQYTNDIFTNIQNDGELIKSFLTFDRLIPHFYDLAKTNKVSAKKYLIELLKEKRDVYKKNPKKVPDLDTLVFFKLVSLLYPTSDFRHPVTTPSLIFMAEILTTAKFNSRYSISRGLFITALILEYTVLSKRFVPPAINFLRGIIFLSANTSILNPIQVVPPFRLHKDTKILNLETDCSKMNVENKMAASDLVSEEIDDSFKIRSLLSAVLMLKEVFNNLKDVEAQECIFEPHIKLLGRVELENYPKKIATKITEIVKDMKDSLEVKTYTPLCREKKRPKALRLYEPDVQEVFTGSKSSKLSREQAESARLMTKYKKEMKGALREIRRDKAYIASVKIRQKIHSDNVRRDKVKQIYKDASIQQGELNKMKRMK